MVGLLLHSMLGRTNLSRASNPAASLAATFFGVASLVIGVANFFGSPRGIIPREASGTLPPGSRGMGHALIAVGVAALAWAWRSLRAADVEAVPTARTADDASVSPDGTAALSGGGGIVGMFTGPDDPKLTDPSREELAEQRRLVRPR